ncbi:MAG: hypothetical protein HYZ84_06290 [Candidatus Omnitrophica bacterium]|nr:hypothetical protein [Candidatus Omnitrophota bacterium]
MKKILIVLLVGVMMASLPGLGYAASPWTQEVGYTNQMKGKLDFGVKNLLGGWTEIFRSPMRAHEGKTCPIRGTGIGIVNAVVYTVGGALHTVTFPFTFIDIPLPNNGVQLD